MQKLLSYQILLSPTESYLVTNLEDLEITNF